MIGKAGYGLEVAGLGGGDAACHLPPPSRKIVRPHALAVRSGPMPPAHLVILVLLSVSPAAAQPLPAVSGCGGDAYSSAQVIEHRPVSRGPITAVPDTLCADLSPQGPSADVRIDAYPIITPEVGSGRGGVPYGSGPPRPFRP